MPVQTNCPACNQQVRVPDQLLGKNVKCPACGHIFLAGGGTAPTTRAESAAPPPPRPRPPEPEPEQYEEQPAEYDDYGEERPRRRRRRRRSAYADEAGGRLTAPAICLFVVGLLMALFGLGGTIIVVAQGGADAAMKQQGNGIPNDPAEKMGFYFGFYGVYLGPVIQGLGVIIGAGCMIARKLRGLAITGSVIAMLPCTCCLLSLPFGIWSMIVLLNSDVAEAFS
jgi:predicted Zn finger-like uncharacterized protein